MVIKLLDNMIQHLWGQCKLLTNTLLLPPYNDLVIIQVQYLLKRFNNFTLDSYFSTFQFTLYILLNFKI